MHAVGTSTLGDGSPVLVRTDARATEEGMFFRLRYRVQGSHHEEEAGSEDGCEDGGEDGCGGGGEDGCEDETWTRFPPEGWYPLDQLRVHAADED